jgi:hypothetical protein
MPSNVLEESSKKILLFKNNGLIRFLGFKIHYITPKNLSKIIVDSIYIHSEFSHKVIFASDIISHNPLKFEKIKIRIHLFMTKYFSSFVPYFLFYFDTRNFKING